MNHQRLLETSPSSLLIAIVVVLAGIHPSLASDEKGSGNSSEHVSEQTPANPAQEQKPLVLQGGVDHSEKLAPVEKQYRRGAKVDLSATKTLALENKWYPLPKWATGKWTSIPANPTIRTYTKDLISGHENSVPATIPTKMEFNWGFQKDKTGQVWEFAKEPYILTVDNSDKVVLKKVMTREFLEADDSKVTLKTLVENVVVSKFTNQVIRTMRSENIQTCRPTESNCMTCKASYKMFDEQGRAVEIGEETNKSRKIAEFKSIDEYEHKNMPELFREFLRSEGKSELIE